MDETKPGDEPPPSSSGDHDEISILRRSFYRLLRRIKEFEAERERTQRNLLLTEKMVAIGKLTAGVAHEINNPLVGLLNCIYHFRRGGLSPERQKEYLQLMEDGIKRIQKTVSNLLEYAHNPKLEKKDNDLRQVIESSLSLLDYQIRKNRIKIIKEIPDELPPIKIDGNQISQVFVNIFLNSIQAMEEEGILIINTKTSKDKILIKISDNGKGIA